VRHYRDAVAVQLDPAQSTGAKAGA